MAEKLPQCPICHTACRVSFARAGDKIYECQNCFHKWITTRKISQAELDRFKAIEAAAVDAVIYLPVWIVDAEKNKSIYLTQMVDANNKLRKALEGSDA